MKTNTFKKLISSDVTASVVAVAVSLAIALFASASSNAAPAPTVTGNGLRVSPVSMSITVKPGTSQTIQVDVENVTKTATTLETIVNDFSAANESGQPDIILNKNAEAPEHSLKQFAEPAPNFTLAAGEDKTINVTFNVPAGTAGGGYYGVVRFLPVSIGDSSKNVSVAASVGTLVLMKVPGNLNENLSITSFAVSSNPNNASGGTLFTSGHNLNAVVRFENNGNIQEAPFGKVLLKQGSKILESKEINNTNPPGNVLPGQIRLFSLPLDKVGSWGKYTVEGNFGYGTSGQLLSAQKTIYVVPLAVIIAVIVIIILIIIGIILGRREMKRHDRKLLAKYRSRRR